MAPDLQEGNFQLIGADVCALYPSLQQVETAMITAKAVQTTNLEFEGVSYDELSVYLALTIGREGMREWGVEHCYPRRLIDSNSFSLSSKINKEMANWGCLTENYSEGDRKNLLAAMIQVAVMVMMQTSCYSFGGKLYLQQTGSGIGLRGSACAAKLVMAVWDCHWARVQKLSGLKVHLFMRYIDDIRIYMRAIPWGWQWSDQGWSYNKDTSDTRNAESI